MTAYQNCHLCSFCLKPLQTSYFQQKPQNLISQTVLENHLKKLTFLNEKCCLFIGITSFQIIGSISPTWKSWRIIQTYKALPALFFVSLQSYSLFEANIMAESLYGCEEIEGLCANHLFPRIIRVCSKLKPLFFVKNRHLSVQRLLGLKNAPMLPGCRP